jgi:hypothetical protein
LLASALAETCRVFIVNGLQAEAQLRLMLALILHGNI